MQPNPFFYFNIQFDGINNDFVAAPIMKDYKHLCTIIIIILACRKYHVMFLCQSELRMVVSDKSYNRNNLTS